MNPQITWYAARAGGIIAWGLLSGGVICGLLLAARMPGRRGAHSWLLDVHRFVGALALVFCGVHLGALVADNYVHFDLRALFVPFGSEWRPAAVAWGVVAFHLLVAVEVTSLLMHHIGRGLWRAIHELSFVVWIAATVHGIQAGTDATNVFYRAVVVAALALVAVCGGLRVTARARRRGRRGAPVAPDREPVPV